jgi:acetoacetyl-CoA synthetase
MASQMPAVVQTEMKKGAVELRDMPMPEIADSLVVDTGSLEDAVGKMWLFVVLREGFDLDADLRRRIKDLLKTELSPRHVPDQIRAITLVPRTLNGKKLEVPVKRILLGEEPSKVASRDTLANPAALDALVELIEEEKGAGTAAPAQEARKSSGEKRT